MNMKRSYKLAAPARTDLWHIYIWGLETFGKNEAMAYQDILFEHFDLITENPDMFFSVSHLRNGYRRCTVRSHSIYFFERDEQIIIARIIGRQDPLKSLSGQFE